MSEHMANMYCLELDEWQQVKNTNINHGDFTELFKRAKENSETEKNNKIAFNATWILRMKAELVVNPVSYSEDVVFMSPDRASYPPQPLL